jgi:flagellar basal-body rod protein FlgF
MDNSIYIMLSRQQGLFRDMEVTANNMANVNTSGYNAQRTMFSDYLVPDGSHQDAYVNEPMAWRDTTPGAVQTTNNPFDLAIGSQNGYFQVQTPQGVRYTRAGNFQINAEGTIVTVQGYPVLGTDGGEISVPDNAKNILINGAGQVTADGEDIGQVGVMSFANEQAMVRTGNTLFSAKETPQQSEVPALVQGAIETSNVNPVSEMVKVIELGRTTTNTAKFVEIMYDLQRKTSSTYAKQSA